MSYRTADPRNAERRLAAAMGIAPARRVHPRPVGRGNTAGSINCGLGERYAVTARRVGGLDAAARFAWLLGFARLSAEEIAGSALIEIREELVAFALLQGLRGTPVSRAIERLPPETIRKLVSAVRGALASLSRAGGEWALDASSRLRRRFLRRGDGSVTIDYLGQQFADVFLWSVGDLLQTYGARLAECRRKGCGGSFIRQTRGQYCSVRCAQQVRNDRVRATLTAVTRAARNAKRRAHYKHQRQRELGPHIRIGARISRREAAAVRAIEPSERVR